MARTMRNRNRPIPIWRTMQHPRLRVLPTPHWKIELQRNAHKKQSVSLHSAISFRTYRWLSKKYA
eukprot:6483073-Amphidinium_carterae.1